LDEQAQGIKQKDEEVLVEQANGQVKEQM